MDKKTITSNPEIPDEVWDRLKNKLKNIDPSRRESDKHYVETALILTDHLLEEKYSEMEADVMKIKKELQDLENVLEK